MEKEVNSVKRQSVIKIKNLKYNMYISTEMKKLDGEAEEGDDGGEKKDDDAEADKNQNDANESQLNVTNMDRSGVNASNMLDNSDDKLKVPNSDDDEE